MQDPDTVEGHDDSPSSCNGRCRHLVQKKASGRSTLCHNKRSIHVNCFALLAAAVRCLDNLVLLCTSEGQGCEVNFGGFALIALVYWGPCHCEKVSIGRHSASWRMKKDEALFVLSWKKIHAIKISPAIIDKESPYFTQAILLTRYNVITT